MSSKNKKVTVVIPIYKEQLSNMEIISLRQAFKCFKAYTITFIAPAGLSLDCYRQITGEQKVVFKFYEKEYFDGISGYNNLLLSVTFYQSFESYRYILIYQLDGFVFRDELSEWCSKGYDYIGAPWFRTFNKSHKKEPLFHVGNGGVSLRKIAKFIKVLSSSKKVNPIYKIRRHYILKGPSFLLFKKFVYSLFNWKSISIQSYLEKYRNNEDVFWGIEAKILFKDFHVAPVKEAIAFSFECEPERLYKLNNSKLPFTCHAWEKYQKEFWKPYIDQEVNNV